MAGLSLVAGPSGEPVTLAEAKLFARITTATEDQLVTDLIVGARKLAEEWLNRSFITQTWDLFLDCFPRDTNWYDEAIILPRPPIQSVTSVKYTPYNAGIVTVSSTDYYLDNASDNHGSPREARVMPVVGKTWPSDRLRVLNGVEVRFVAGYGVAASVPEHIRAAINQLVAFWYQNRDTIGQMPEHVGNTLTGTVGGYAFA